MKETIKQGKLNGTKIQPPKKELTLLNGVSRKDWGKK
jgi:hypothetical protein